MTEELSHELEGKGSLRKCIHCGRWFHNEADAGEEEQPCPGRGDELHQERSLATCAGCGLYGHLGDTHFRRDTGEECGEYV